jgi:hypothetical protein
MPTIEKINRVHNARRKLRRRSRDVKLQDIAEAYSIPFHWLKTFNAGKHPNPHTRLLEQLEMALADLETAGAL